VTTPTPWWATDPELAEIRRRTAERFGIVLDAAEPVGSDELVEPDEVEPDEPADPGPVLTEIFDGRCRRELGRARDALEDARERYDAAVLAARDAGFSWGEIGCVLGVSKQQLHRRFVTRRRGRPHGRPR
jgi:DNA-directed RNA polymerase specialized sigma24 family protein